MTPPRRIVPGSFFYVTSRCVNRSFRLVPRQDICQAIRYCLAYVAQKYRSQGQLELYEFVFMSNHFHILGRDVGGVLPNFICDFNSLLSRQLNALRGINGKNFESGYGMQVVEDEERILEHAVYTLLNPVAAFLVTHANKWRGVSSSQMEYGTPVVVRRPRRGLWSKSARHSKRRESQASKRACYANRIKAPEEVHLVLDRPPILQALTDAELRTEIHRRVAEHEASIEARRKRAKRGVLGMRAVRERSFLSLPGREEMFARRPSLSASNGRTRKKLFALRRAFLDAYAAARDAFFAGHHETIFPEGTWLMVRRYGVRAEPLGAS